jgi:Spy/CpxP family protein refolding chaperone
MRRLMLPVIALSLAAMPAMTEAQTPRAQRSAAEGHGPRLMIGGNPAARVLQHREALGLTAAQVQQLEQLQQQITQRNEPLLQQLQAVRPTGSPARGAQRAPERRDQMQQHMQERQAQLTPEQRERLQALREQARDASPEQRAQLRAQMQEQMRELRAQVTPEQREQVRQRMEQRRAERQQPTAEQRARMDAVRPVMQQLRASNQQARRDVEAVLTAEQQTRLRELVSQRTGEWRERRGTPGERPGPAGRRGPARR